MRTNLAPEHTTYVRACGAIALPKSPRARGVSRADGDGSNRGDRKQGMCFTDGDVVNWEERVFLRRVEMFAPHGLARDGFGVIDQECGLP